VEPLTGVALPYSLVLCPHPICEYRTQSQKKQYGSPKKILHGYHYRQYKGFANPDLARFPFREISG
jgi:hypothetical protein